MSQKVFVSGVGMIPFAKPGASSPYHEMGALAARAVSLGYDVDRYKLMAFVLSAALAGLAGATKALSLGLATLTDVGWQMSGEVVLMTLLGGLGTILGPTAGAFIVVTLQNYLASLEGWVTVITGTIFVLCVLAFRRGVEIGRAHV